MNIKRTLLILLSRVIRGEFLVGYLIYRFAYAYIYDEWNDYH